jgi:hypothetical protein
MLLSFEMFRGSRARYGPQVDDEHPEGELERNSQGTST